MTTTATPAVPKLPDVQPAKAEQQHSTAKSNTRTLARARKSLLASRKTLLPTGLGDIFAKSASIHRRNDLRGSSGIPSVDGNEIGSLRDQHNHKTFTDEPTKRQKTPSTCGLAEMGGAQSDSLSSSDPLAQQERSKACELSKTDTPPNNQRQLKRSGTLASARRSVDVSLACSPSFGKIRVADWPNPKECDESFRAKHAKFKFCGPLAYLYPDACIDWPKRRYTASEWARTMSPSARWPSVSAEDSLMATACQALLINADHMRRALQAMRVSTAAGYRVKLSMIEQLSMSMHDIGHFLDSIWEIHSKHLASMDGVLRLKFPSNLETLHFRAHKKVAGLISTLESAAFEGRIATCMFQEISDEFNACCTVLLRLSQVTLEDALFFYRFHYTEAKFLKMERATSHPILESDHGASTRMLVGGTPACQRADRLKHLLHYDTAGFEFAVKVATRVIARSYHKRYYRPLQTLCRAGARVLAREEQQQ